MSRIGSAFALLLLLPTMAFADDLQRGQEALKAKDFDKAIACFRGPDKTP